MQTNKDKAFCCLHHHLERVLIPLLAESLLIVINLKCSVFLSCNLGFVFPMLQLEQNYLIFPVARSAQTQ